MNRKRLPDIDILRALAIILVVVGHISLTYLPADLHKWIYAFHIPLFFFISGMTLSFQNYQNTSMPQLLKKRFTRLYLPYLLWALILALPHFSVLTIPAILYGTHHSLGLYSSSSLWFLPVLFFSTLLSDLILFMSSRRKHTPPPRIIFTLIILLIISILLPSQAAIHSTLGHNIPLGLDIVPMATFFMLCGYLFQKQQSLTKLARKPFVAATIFCVSILATTFFGLANNINYVLMAENRYGNFPYFFIAAFAGIVAFIILSKAIAKHTQRLSTALTKIGADTMMIFILHKYPLKVLAKLTTYLPVTIPAVIFIPLSLACSITFCILASKIISKFAPALLGQKNSSQY